jgi:hypothetical protein
MTCAVCLQCGAFKFGAWTRCPKCFFQPDDDVTRAQHLCVSDHYLTHRRLEEISEAVRKGEPVAFPSRVLTTQIFGWTYLKAFLTSLVLAPLLWPVHLYLVDLFQIQQSQVVPTRAGMACLVVLAFGAAIPGIKAQRRLSRDLRKHRAVMTTERGQVTVVVSSPNQRPSDPDSEGTAERGA